MSAIAIVPSAPVLVPELGRAAELADLRAAVLAAAALLPPRWIVIGTGGADAVMDPDSWVPSRASEQTCGSGSHHGAARSPAALPLCALIAGWVRGQARPEAGAQVRVYRGDHDAETAVARGRQLRAEIDRATEPIGVLVVADGANTLTERAPGGYDPVAAEVQLALDDALADGDVAALTRLPGQILGRVAFQVLAGLTEPGPRTAKELYRGAPYGVGYFAGVWQP